MGGSCALLLRGGGRTNFSKKFSCLFVFVAIIVYHCKTDSYYYYEKAIQEIRTSHFMCDATVLYHLPSCRPGAVLV